MFLEGMMDSIIITCLLGTNDVSISFFTVCDFTKPINIISTHHKLMCSIQFQTLLVYLGLPNCIILSEGDEVSPTSGNTEQQVHQMSTCLLLNVSFKQILINLPSFMRTAISVRILHKTPLIIKSKAFLKSINISYTAP